MTAVEKAAAVLVEGTGASGCGGDDSGDSGKASANTSCNVGGGQRQWKQTIINHKAAVSGSGRINHSGSDGDGNGGGNGSGNGGSCGSCGSRGSGSGDGGANSRGNSRCGATVSYYLHAVQL